MAFLGNALTQGHARVRAVAQGVLDSIDEDIQAGQDISTQPHPIERRIQSRVAAAGGESSRFFSFTRDVVRRLRSDSTNGQKGADHHDQNLNTAGNRVRISNAGSCSSYIYKTTTTGEVSNFAHTGENDQPLIYPPRLCDNHREIAARYLSVLAPEQRQPVLDELAGRFLAEQKGMKPVYDELSFLHSLCKQVEQGKFIPNLGIKLRDGRQEHKKPDQKVSPAT